MTARLNWDRDGRDWPNRAFSRFVTAGGLRWHVQVMGEGPVVLLIHGTGAATHSFRALAPMLAAHFTVVAPDLPGHGFTAEPAHASGYSLPGVASGIAALLQTLGLRPVLAAGHSAGAAVAIRMTLDGSIAPATIVSLNGALLPFPGMTHDIFAPVARFLASSRLTAAAFSTFVGSRPSVERLLRSTGSHIDAEGVRYYGRLTANPGHVHGALALMANWDLRPLLRELPRLAARLILVVGRSDGMVPPAEAYRVRAAVPTAEIIALPGLGHLAHEERPEEIVRIIRQAVAHDTPDEGPRHEGPRPPEQS
ncbi:MAG: alpha/beta hydrolase [Rhodospirillales bacterium 20-64-7]|nr:MAG: alpha/beta hydrolase [Rhodospirillales bacterium 20-64-7]HQT75635.1 alpha/beta fold hydrolase [Rhodopila sp.]